MRLTQRMKIVAGVIGVCGLVAADRLTYAGGCCGGGGGSGGVRYSARGSFAASPRGTCGMAGMNMDGMAMAAMPMSAPSMRGMTMRSAAAPAPAAKSTPAVKPSALAASSYSCPMHPGVVASGPATCPSCKMALKKQ